MPLNLFALPGMRLASSPASPCADTMLVPMSVVTVFFLLIYIAVAAAASELLEMPRLPATAFVVSCRREAKAASPPAVTFTLPRVVLTVLRLTSTGRLPLTPLPLAAAATAMLTTRL